MRTSPGGKFIRILCAVVFFPVVLMGNNEFVLCYDGDGHAAIEPSMNDLCFEYRDDGGCCGGHRHDGGKTAAICGSCEDSPFTVGGFYLLSTGAGDRHCLQHNQYLPAIAVLNPHHLPEWRHFYTVSAASLTDPPGPDLSCNSVMRI